MAGLLGSLHSAKTGMSVSQASIQTTSHNINNINTPGYSRQRVNQSARSAYSNPGFNSSMGPGQLGTGVEVDSITRIRNTFYDYQFRSESHNYGETSIKYEAYKNMESIFNEPSDTSISSSLNEFYNSWHELSKDPNNIGAKNIVVETSKYLANNINKVYQKLDTLQTNLNKQKNELVSDINDILSRLEELETNIKIVEGSGKIPNDLYDDRDNMLDELSFKININDPKVQTALSKKDPNTGEYLTANEIDDLENISGELSGYIKMDKEISYYKEKMNDLAKSITDSVNKVYKLEGKDKEDFFIFNKDGNPIIKVNENIEKNPSNMDMTSAIATEMYNLKNKKVTIGQPPQDITINNFYNNVVQQLGQSSQTVIKDEINQSKLMESIESSRTNISGVSLDEEMVSLVQFQHAYNASAKVVSTIDSLLDVVINGLKR